MPKVNLPHDIGVDSFVMNGLSFAGYRGISYGRNLCADIFLTEPNLQKDLTNIYRDVKNQANDIERGSDEKASCEAAQEINSRISSLDNIVFDSGMSDYLEQCDKLRNYAEEATDDIFNSASVLSKTLEIFTGTAEEKESLEEALDTLEERLIGGQSLRLGSLCETLSPDALDLLKALLGNLNYYFLRVDYNNSKDARHLKFKYKNFIVLSDTIVWVSISDTLKLGITAFNVCVKEGDNATLITFSELKDFFENKMYPSRPELEIYTVSSGKLWGINCWRRAIFDNFNPQGLKY